MSTSLCQYEIEKREAVTKEDYDSAKEIKVSLRNINMYVIVIMML